MTDKRACLIQLLADDILKQCCGKRSIVGIDGVDGAGKTILADELAENIRIQGHLVIRAGVDGFHNPRSLRYKQGKDSPVGFFEDSYNYQSIQQLLLGPFREGGTRVQLACFDHRTDSEVHNQIQAVPETCLLICDGIFLHRSELASYWDYSVFIDVPFSITYARMAVRDGCPPDPTAPANRRYVEGQKLYLKEYQPKNLATRVIDNTDIKAPCLIGP